MERLNPRVRVVWVVGALFRAGIFGSLLVGGALSLSASSIWSGADRTIVWSAVLVAVVLAVAGLLVAWIRYGVWRFEVQGDALYIEHGVFTRVKTVVPFVRVQHVDSQRGPLERGIGLATVVVYTAGSRSADVSIPGLTPGRAEDLREELRRLAIASEGEDAV